MVNGFTLGVAYRAKVASDDKRGRHMSCSDCMSKQQQAQAKSGRVSSGGADRDRPQARRSGRVQGWVIQSLQLVGANQETSAPTLLLPDANDTVTRLAQRSDLSKHAFRIYGKDRPQREQIRRHWLRPLQCPALLAGSAGVADKAAA